MKIKIMNGLPFLVLFVLFSYKSSANNFTLKGNPDDSIKISNIRAELTNDNKVIILFDLAGPKEQEFIIDLSLKRAGDKSFIYKPKLITGDVGKGFYSGKDKKIVWDLSKEFALGLEKNDYYFTVDAEIVKLEKITKKDEEDKELYLEQSSDNLYYYIGGGVAVIGTAVYFLTRKKIETEVLGNFPEPPALPK